MISYGAVSDRGDIRKENQDSMLSLTGEVCGEPAALFAVADGMGGLSYGSQVSNYITGQFNRWWEEDFPQMMRAGRKSRDDINELLEQEIWDINRQIFLFNSRSQNRAGSTLSLLLLFAGEFYIKNIGDSRVYLLREGILRRMTEDQSLVAQLVRERRMTPEEARTSGKKNVLTMCVGMFAVPQSYSNGGTANAGDRFLVCSDGLYNQVNEEGISRILGLPGKSAQERAVLLRQAIRPGTAGDNVTAVVAHV